MARRLWLANLPKPAGDLVLDAGRWPLSRKVESRCCPLGVRGVRGIFGVGAAVRCCGEDARVIGIGLSNYKSGGN